MVRYKQILATFVSAAAIVLVMGSTADALGLGGKRSGASNRGSVGGALGGLGRSVGSAVGGLGKSSTGSAGRSSGTSTGVSIGTTAKAGLAVGATVLGTKSVAADAAIGANVGDLNARIGAQVGPGLGLSIDLGGPGGPGGPGGGGVGPESDAAKVTTAELMPLCGTILASPARYNGLAVMKCMQQ